MMTLDKIVDEPSLAWLMMIVIRVGDRDREWPGSNVNSHHLSPSLLYVINLYLSKLTVFRGVFYEFAL